MGIEWRTKSKESGLWEQNNTRVHVTCENESGHVEKHRHQHSRSYTLKKKTTKSKNIKASFNSQ
jgi:hypothetical protein